MGAVIVSEAWDRLIRQMIREFLSHAGESLTFGRLSFLIRAHSGLPADPDLVHVVAEQRPDLFMITQNDRDHYARHKMCRKGAPEQFVQPAAGLGFIESFFSERFYECGQRLLDWHIARTLAFASESPFRRLMVVRQTAVAPRYLSAVVSTHIADDGEECGIDNWLDRPHRLSLTFPDYRKVRIYCD